MASWPSGWLPPPPRQKQAAGALAKQQAIENLRSKQVREVLNYTQWLTLERRWAQKALQAAGKGDHAKAAEYGVKPGRGMKVAVMVRRIFESIDGTAPQPKKAAASGEPKEN